MDSGNTGTVVGDYSFDIRKDFPAPVFPVTPLDPKYLRNGLIVRMPNHLGDAVMALPALAQFRKLLPPYCALCVIVPEILRPLFESVPCVDCVFSLEKPHKFWSFSEIRKLKQLRAGYGVLLNNSFRDALMMRLAGIPNLYGASARFRSWLLTRAFSFPRLKRRKLVSLHHGNRYLSMAYALGAEPWDGIMPLIEPSAESCELDLDIAAICEHPKLLVLGAGAAYGAAKRWPSEDFRVVAHYWVRHGGIVAAVGSRSEQDVCNDIFLGLSERKTFNLAGKSSMIELIHLLKNAAAVVANDSGVMHLAAALGRPGVAVFGPTDYTSTGPLNPNWHILYEKLACAPCYCRECPTGSRECIRKITPSMVIRSLHRIEKRLNAVRH